MNVFVVLSVVTERVMIVVCTDIRVGLMFLNWCGSCCCVRCVVFLN